jgi:hypothetical protein
MAQPAAQVTPEDVQRLVRREFGPDREAEILALLDEYGTEDWHREPDRVRAACLKLAAGNLDRLQNQIEIAKQDWRDVLGPAEYPGYTKHMFRIKNYPEAEQERIINDDWRQYQEWFTH